ncbi:MAG: hypothetical protein IKH30_14920 [Clostridia bacterium]|nr:hypothetical protein [Clostridia bacterium]
MKKTLSLFLAVAMLLSVHSAVLAENTEAPRSYFPYPAELENLPENPNLPDLFEFYDKTADPDGSGRVETPDEWDARAAEIKDMAQYYLYGSRMDPLKSDTAVTAVRENYDYQWADGIMQSAPSRWGYTALPRLPENSFTMTERDFSAWGMGLFYSDIAPNDSFVYSGEDFEMPEGLAAWKEGDTWQEHTDAVTRVTLPTVTVEMLIKDTNPANAAYVSEAAKEGVTWTFSVRFPAEAPTVDGIVRDAHSSRYGTGYPLVVAISGLTEQQIVTLNNNGYAYIQVNDTADPDNGQVSVYEKLYPPKDIVVHNDNTTENEYMVDSGDLMHSAWIASRALDAIENYMALSAEEKEALNENVIIPDIDVYSSAVTGCSNNGKRALMAALYDTGDNGDTRFDIAAPCDSGSAGLIGFRYLTEGELFSYEPPIQDTAGTVNDFPYGLNETMQRAIQNTGEDQWFLDRAQIFTVRPDVADNTPFDIHSVLASFATPKEERYIITWTGEGTNGWGNHPACILNILAAKEAFELLGQGGNVVAIARDLAHASQDRDLPELMAIMDHLFYGTENFVRKYHKTLTKENGIEAIDGNGTIMPTKVYESAFEMTRYPYYLSSSAIRWARPGKHILWTEQNNVTEGVPMTFQFHTDAAKVELTLTDGETVLSADAVDGIATISITAEQAKGGRYSATAIGDLDSRTIDICGWTINDALRHAVGDNSALGHDVGSGICFTTKLTNYDSTEDPVLLYLNGEAVPADIYDYDNKIVLEDGTVIPQSGYLQPFGATLTLYPGTMGYEAPMGGVIVFSVRNAKIEALQGYIVNMDVEYEKFCPSGNRMRFKTTYQTINTQTPTWQPELRQNTPKLGLPKDDNVWPILGNWYSDYDENGAFKPLDEIRPAITKDGKSAYAPEITLAASDENGFVLSFSKPVNPHDFALAVNTVSGYEWTWDEGCQTVTVTYAEPVEAGTEVSVFVFRSVDMEGNMIGGPVHLTAAAQ